MAKGGMIVTKPYLDGHNILVVTLAQPAQAAWWGIFHRLPGG